ncbi:MAG: hypothetical protein HN509_13845 [Halobacteriovoraceae bacterium]|jgi:hypothetical protein|nr:hypothetical protein [Halobacteriovoraceae bacterium]
MLLILLSPKAFGDELFSKHYRKCSRPNMKRCSSLFGSQRVPPQKWYEFDYVYINRQTKWANKKLLCNSSSHKKCVVRANKKAEEERRLAGIKTSESEKQRMKDVEARAVKLHSGNISFKHRAEAQAAEDHYRVMTLGFSDIDTSCGIKNVISQVAEKLADDVLTSLGMVCEQAGKAFKPIYDRIHNDVDLLRTYGLAPDQLLEGKGINVGIFAQAIAGANINLEAIVHGSGKDACLGLMCVAGAGLSYFAGAGASAAGVYTLGCRNNWEYLGSFVTVGATFKYLGGVEISYSFGVDHHAFLTHLQKSFGKDTRKRKEYFEQLNQEMLKFLETSRARDEQKLSWLLLMKLVNGVTPLDQQTIEHVDRELAAGKGLKEKLEAWGKREKRRTESRHKQIDSAGRIFKKSLSAMATMPGAPALVKELAAGANQALTGCDSMTVGISGGPQVGGGPLTRLTEYTLAGELPLADLEYIAGLMVGGPALMGAMACADQKRFKEKMGNVLGRLKDIKDNIGSCMDNSSQQLASHAVRLGQIATGEPLVDQLNGKHLNYNLNYRKTHPNHQMCSCGAKENPKCSGE